MSENESKQEKSVNRRKFLKGGAVAATAAAATVAFPQVSRAQTVTLKMQSGWPATEMFQDMARQYVERVEKMSGGRLKIDLLAAGAVVKAFQVQDGVNAGTLDGGHHVSAYWYSKNKAASLFGTAPVFGTDAAQIIAWVQYGGGKELYKELVSSMGLNVVGFFCMPMPTQPFGWFKKEIKGLADVQGLKYRTVGLATEIMTTVGMSVVSLPGGEIIPALEKGAIEAFEFNNPSSDRRFGAPDVANRYMLGSYHQAAEFFEIIFNKTKFESLAPELQAILEYGAEAANTANYNLAMSEYSKDLEWMIKEKKITVVRTPKEIMDAQLKGWDAALKKFSDADPFFKKVVDSQRAWAERVGFYHHMNSADFRAAYNHFFPGKLSA
jgi:TRAP-type mannitol/chloroaromatic compound transport system substrate-binding protein